MEDIGQHTPESASVEFAPEQRQALATWAQGFSDYRLEITRCQLLKAISLYNNRDETLTGLALVARMGAISAEIDRRGGVPLMDPILVPWGKPIESVNEWTLTDFTRLQSLEDPTQAQTVIHPPTVTDTVADQANLSTPWAHIHHPTLTYRLVTKDAQNVSPPADTDLYVQWTNIITTAAIQEMHDNGFAADQLYKVWVIDRANNSLDAEIYRLAENDTSGLPIISCDVLDVYNDGLLPDAIVDECKGDATTDEHMGDASNDSDEKSDDLFVDLLNQDPFPDLWQPGA